MSEPAASNRFRIAALTSLSAFSILAIIGGIFASWFAVPTAAWFLGHLGYWFIWALVLVWLWLLTRVLREVNFSPRKWLRAHASLLVFCGVLTGLCLYVVPPKFRILSDEANLLGTSRSMFEHATIYNVVQAFRFKGFEDVQEFEIPNRPLLFPFLEHLIHWTRGYHWQNGFVLNALIFFLLLTTIGVVVQKKLGIRKAAAAILLVASSPVVIFSASSGGFDLTSVYLLGLSFLSLYFFLVKRTPLSLAFLSATFMLFAHVRYESLAAFTLVGFILAWLGYLSPKTLGLYGFYHAASPLFALPLFLQHFLKEDRYFNFVPGRAVFSFDHFLTNLSSGVAAHFSAPKDFQFDSQLNFLTVIIGILLFFKVMSGRQGAMRIREIRNFWWIVVAVLGLLLIIHASHYAGSPVSRTQARFYLPYVIAGALVPFIWIFQYRRTLPDFIILGFAVLFFGPHLYHASWELPVHIVPVTKETYQIQEFLQEQNQGQKQDPRRILVVNDRPGIYLVQGYSAITFKTFNARYRDIMADLVHNYIEHIYIFQKTNLPLANPHPEDHLDPGLALRRIASGIELGPGEYLQVWTTL